MMRIKWMKQGEKPAARWAGMLFGLLFFSVGAGFLVLGVIPNIWDALRMQEWSQVPAEVEALELKTNHSDDSTTYQVIARFRYDYKGQHYSGSRVGIADGGSDNIGDWHRDTWRRLGSDDRIHVWVNPEDPTESVYDRE